MKKKHIKLILVGLFLLLGCTYIITYTTSQPVQATTYKFKKLYRSQGYTKVKLTKNIYIRKIHLRDPIYKSTLGRKIKVKKGKIVSVFLSGTNFGWYLHLPHSSTEYTIVTKYTDTSWFTFNLKTRKKKVNKKTHYTKPHYIKITNKTSKKEISPHNNTSSINQLLYSHGFVNNSFITKEGVKITLTKAVAMKYYSNAVVFIEFDYDTLPQAIVINLLNEPTNNKLSLIPKYIGTIK